MFKMIFIKADLGENKIVLNYERRFGIFYWSFSYFSWYFGDNINFLWQTEKKGKHEILRNEKLTNRLDKRGLAMIKKMHIIR